MKITVQLLGQARQLSPSDRVVLNVEDGSSVDEIVPVLLDGASDSLRMVLSEGTEALQLRRSVMAIHNDQTIEPATRDLLKDGDALSLLPPMSGG
ncbi:MAG: MoaD/ThiS family protein [Roseibacillus sp.]|nr:MoaD/ThiS family protein [Roseibacillus sp.]